MNVDKISIQEAADLMEIASHCEVIHHGGMHASVLTVNGEKAIVVQGSGEDFLLFR